MAAGAEEPVHLIRRHGTHLGFTKRVRGHGRGHGKSFTIKEGGSWAQAGSKPGVKGISPSLCLRFPRPGRDTETPLGPDGGWMTFTPRMPLIILPVSDRGELCVPQRACSPLAVPERHNIPLPGDDRTMGKLHHQPSGLTRGKRIRDVGEQRAHTRPALASAHEHATVLAVFLPAHGNVTVSTHPCGSGSVIPTGFPPYGSTVVTITGDPGAIVTETTVNVAPPGGDAHVRHGPGIPAGTAAAPQPQVATLLAVPLQGGASAPRRKPPRPRTQPPAGSSTTAGPAAPAATPPRQ